MAWTRQAFDPGDFETNGAFPPHHSQVLDQWDNGTEVPTTQSQRNIELMWLTGKQTLSYIVFNKIPFIPSRLH